MNKNETDHNIKTRTILQTKRNDFLSNSFISFISKNAFPENRFKVTKNKNTINFSWVEDQMSLIT